MDWRLSVAPPGRPSIRTVVTRWTPLAATLAVIVGFGWFVLRGNTASFVSGLAAANWLVVGGGTGLYAASWWFRGRRFQSILDAIGHRCRTSYLVALIFLSQTVNLVLPARAGDLVRATILTDRDGVPLTAGIAALSVERLFDLLAILSIGGLAAVGLWGVGSLEGVPTGLEGSLLGVVVVLAIGCGLAGILALAIHHRGNRWRSHRWFRPVIDAIRHYGTSLRAVADSPRALLRVTGLSGAIWLADILTAVMILVALPIPEMGAVTLLLAGTLAVALGNVAKIVPLTQGGIGLYEGAVVAVLVATTPIGLELALLAAILDHGIKNGVTVLGGVIAQVSLHRMHDDAAWRSDTGRTANLLGEPKNSGDNAD